MAEPHDSSSSPHESVSLWLDQLKAGDSAAAQRLWQRYQERLIRLVSRRLGELPRRMADEDDAVNSAFHDFLRGVQEGRFTRLDDQEDLWQLLVMLTERKASGLRRKIQAEKRGRGHVRGESALEMDFAPRSAAPGIDQPAGFEPTPQFAAEVQEEFGRLYGLLADDTLRQIARAKLEGYTNAELAAQLKLSVRTVERKLQLIRHQWTHDPDVEMARLIGDVSDEFERAWKSGRIPRIEDYLDRVPAAGRLRLLEELLAVEFELCEDQSLDVESYRQRFPDSASAISAALALREQREQDDLPRTASPSTVGDGDEDAEPGLRHIGRFLIRRRLGTGGVGVVYLAWDPELKRFVALKVRRRELLVTGQQRDNFLHETHRASSLRHPALVTVYEAGQDNDLIYVVQEYIKGQNLAQWAAAQPRSWEDIVHQMVEITTTIGFVHDQGFVHRNLKPTNILVDCEGHAHVADLGFISHEEALRLLEEGSSGVLPYLSPEQVRGQTHRIDGRTDIWALGVMLYELLAGERPFTASDAPALFAEIQERAPKSLRKTNPSIPTELERICLTCLAKRPAQRFASAMDLHDALRSLLATSSGTADLAPTGRTDAPVLGADSESVPGGGYRTGPDAARTNSREPSRQVYLGVSVPLCVQPGCEFVARFAAYTQAFRSMARAALTRESAGAKTLLDLHTCQWRVGTKVSVQLTARGLNIANQHQEFIWNGQWVVVRFDVDIPDDYSEANAILKFNIIIDGMIVATLRPELNVRHQAHSRQHELSLQFELPSPRSAFASYSAEDRNAVLGRIRSVEIAAGITAFVDCLSIKPGDQWKPVVLRAIREADVFWLFWSRNAMNSPWVDWEWRTALKEKTKDQIQPHPLEPSEVAPPPKELEDVQFGSAYEWYLMSVRPSWWSRFAAFLRHTFR